MGRKPARRAAAFRPMPEVVGITVHLTFASRAFELRSGTAAAAARSFWADCTCCPAPTSARRTPTRWPSATACSFGRGFWPTSSPAACSRDTPPPMRMITATIPRPRRSILPRNELSHHHQPDCHSRLPQSVRLLLSGTDGLRMPYRMRDPAQIAAEFAADGQPYAVFIDNNLGSNRDVSARTVPRAAAAEQDLERGGLHRRHRRSQL